MKNSKIKLFIMFLAGIIFSTLAVFAANVTIPTSFNNAVQYLQKLVLTDANNVTGIVLDGENKKIMSNQICNTNGTDCKAISELITGVDLSDYLTGTSTFLTGESGKWCIMQDDMIACTEDMPEGGLTEIANYSIKTIHIDTGAITQDQVSGGYVDLSSNQTISGDKIFSSETAFGNNLKISSVSNFGKIKSENNLRLYTSGSIARITINKSGYVGINKENPGANLDVEGTVKMLTSAGTYLTSHQYTGTGPYYFPQGISSGGLNTGLNTDSIRYINCMDFINTGMIGFFFLGITGDKQEILLNSTGIDIAIVQNKMSTLTYHLKAGDTFAIHQSGFCENLFVYSQQYGGTISKKPVISWIEFMTAIHNMAQLDLGFDGP